VTPQAGHAARAARVATVPAQAGPPPEEARPVAPEPTTEPEPEPVAEPTAAPVNGILATAGALIPILTWLPRYRRAGLRNDILAGLVVAALAIPQSMGYAVVAGVGVEVGLYTLPPALLAYVVFGSSRLLVVGPVSTVSLLSGSLVGQLSGGDPARAASLTAALALGAGVVLVLAGLLRIGWVAEFLSEPIVAGFISGLSILVILGQGPVLVGVQGARGGVVEQAFVLTQAIGHEHPGTVLVSVLALGALFGGHRILPQVPWSLVVLTLGIAASHLLDLPGRGVATIGQVPSGLPGLHLPPVRLDDLATLATGAVAIAMVGLAEGLAAGRLFAQQYDDRINTDTELIAHGVADLASGALGGMGAAGSLSKTAANERAGGRSQVVGIVAAVTVLLVVLALSGPMSALPAAVLAAIVVHAVWGLLRPRVLLRYWTIRSNDGLAAVVAMVGVLALGPLYGLLVAIGQSLLGLVYRSTQVHIDEMGKLPEEKAAWGSLTSHPERRTVPGLLVLRLDSPLFWANAATVFDRLLETVLARPDVRIVLLDLEATNQLDATTERRLESFLHTLRAQDKDLYLVRVFHQVRVVMKSSGFFDLLGEGRSWHSIAAAAQAARAVVRVEEAFEAAARQWVPEDDAPPPPDTGGPDAGSRSGSAGHADIPDTNVPGADSAVRTGADGPPGRADRQLRKGGKGRGNGKGAAAERTRKATRKGGTGRKDRENGKPRKGREDRSHRKDRDRGKGRNRGKIRESGKVREGGTARKARERSPKPRRGRRR
jgi:sulfate permease, SulP family